MEKFNMMVDEKNGTVLIGFDDSVDVNFICWTKLEKWLQDKDYYNRVFQFFPIKKFVAIVCDMGEQFNSFVTDLNTFLQCHSDDKPNEMEPKQIPIRQLMDEIKDLKERILKLENKS